MDLMYSMQLGEKPMPVEPDEAVVQKLRYEHGSWSGTVVPWGGHACRAGRAGAG